MRGYSAPLTPPSTFQTPGSDFIEAESPIFNIRGRRVVLDADLARIYRVTTKRFNESVKRNGKRFPEDFAFQLIPDQRETEF